MGPVDFTGFLRGFARPKSCWKSKGCRVSCRGFTLVEVMIASLLLVAIALLMIGLLLTGEKSLGQAAVAADLDARGVQTTESLLRDFAQANFLSVSATNEQIELQVPVDHDGDGDVLDDAGAIDWGYQGQLGWRVRYRAVPEETWDEAALQIDVNRNGVTEIFVRCRIEREILDPLGGVADTSTLDREVLLLQSPLNGDVDGDGQADPLFAQTAPNTLVLNLWHARLDPDRHPVLRRARTQVDLRNAEE